MSTYKDNTETWQAWTRHKAALAWRYESLIMGYAGSPLGCSGAGRYSPSDDTIAAVGYPYSDLWPCGSVLLVDGPTGQLVVVRKDTCPGCGNTLIDLSEAGITQVCGGLGSCQVQVTRLE